MHGSLQVTNKTTRTLPHLPYQKIKDAILGKEYSLSLVFVGNTTSKRLNNLYRKKNKPTNVLSFGVSTNEGEIYIDLKKVESELKLFNTTYTKHVGFLFIHGLLHLKGFDHGSTMEAKEKKFRRTFKV